MINMGLILVQSKMKITDNGVGPLKKILTKQIFYSLRERALEISINYSDKYFLTIL